MIMLEYQNSSTFNFFLKTEAAGLPKMWPLATKKTGVAPEEPNTSPWCPQITSPNTSA